VSFYTAGELGSIEETRVTMPTRLDTVVHTMEFTSIS
jgi:hypothetical protein